MTKTEIERLAIVETKVDDVQTDLTEVKNDVKLLVATQATLAIALAAKNAADEQHTKDRESTGRWLKTFGGWVVAGVSALVAVANFFHLGPPTR